MGHVNRNLGQSTLRRTRRAGDPMATYDRLPRPLRVWLSHAALPWSPASAQRIWTKSRAKGLSPEEALASLNKAETRMLSRDQHATCFKLNAST
ncbi:DUF6525 family protein [Primorskyibacter sp. S187A]|uniref:DUF6525 family protein n=1 Tax=Primorskyibacter sp. S187A TaxID=3415130 RepID=UPI003C7D83FD